MADPVSDLASSPWWVVIAGGFPSIASGLWVFWRWQVERRDKRDETVSTREERLAKEIEDQRAALSKEQAGMFDRLRAELTRTQERNVVLEREGDELRGDVDRWRDVASRWKVRCHGLKHDLGGARGTINAKLAGEGKPEIDWLDEELPALEGIAADNAAYQERKRAWQVRQEQLRRRRITFDPVDPPEG